MTGDEIFALQTQVKARADRFWGPQSIAACQRYLRDKMPHPSPWPKTNQQSLTNFYGAPGDESQLVNLPVVGVKYSGKTVKTIRVHKRCAESLSQIILELADAAPWLLERYDGCYNNRPMRGGSLPSLHARGAAIDFDAANNGNKTHWPTRATMPLEVMAIFARYGWLAAGAFWGRDAMHFQATQ